MADIHGRWDGRFEGVRAALARNLDSGEELGASLVLDIDGDIVIGIWGGFRDQARTVPWTEHTITKDWDHLSPEDQELRSAQACAVVQVLLDEVRRIGA